MKTQQTTEPNSYYQRDLDPLKRYKGEYGQLKQGTKVWCNGHEGAIVRHYDGATYEIRLPGGVVATDDFELTDQRILAKLSQLNSTATPAQASGSCQPSHSPLPWQAVTPQFEDQKGIPWIRSEQGEVIAEVYLGTNGTETVEQAEANAAFIVRACNNYPKLIAICKEIADSQCDLGDSERRIRLYSALKSAGEL